MMKALALTAIFLAAAVGSSAVNEDWAHFKETYDKTYVTAEEEGYRRSAFEQNQLFIAEHNLRFLDGSETYTVRLNEFSDMTSEEFFSKMTGLIPTEEVNDLIPQEVIGYERSDPVANTVDWRDQGAVNPVRGQGSCGSCYAFAAIATLESHHYLKTGDLVQLSEQNAMDCTNNGTQTNDGCHGGNTHHVYEYITRNEGIDTLESYPYEHKDAECRFDPANVGATAYGYIPVTKHDEMALKAAVHDIGPVSVNIHVQGSGFHHYESGVYFNASCPTHDPNHAVVVIGYGTESEGGPYWLVRNSWGHKWGDEGYIKMTRNHHNQCGIASSGAYPIV